MVERENEIEKSCFDACLQIHQHFGPGLLEPAYAAAFGNEFDRGGLKYRKEVPIKSNYNVLPLGLGFRADFIIENLVIVEFKFLVELSAVHYKQLLTYLKATDIILGRLIDFGSLLLKDGFKRNANSLQDPSTPVIMI